MGNRNQSIVSSNDQEMEKKQSVGCGPRVSFRRSSCSKCIKHDTSSPGFGLIPPSVFCEALKYLSSTEAIFIEAVCTSIGSILSGGGWCERLSLDEKWRTPPGNYQEVRLKWFPRMTALRLCVHPPAPSIYSDDSESLPSTATASTKPAPLNHSKGGANLWVDIHASQLAPLFEAASNSLEELDVHYMSACNIFRLRPIKKSIELSVLRSMAFHISGRNADMLAVDSEGIVIAMKNVSLPVCTSVQIGATKSNRLNFAEHVDSETGKHSHGSNQLIIEAFKGILTSQNSFTDLSLMVTDADAQLLTDVLPNVLEV